MDKEQAVNVIPMRRSAPLKYLSAERPLAHALLGSVGIPIRQVVACMKTAIATLLEPLFRRLSAATRATRNISFA